MLKFPTGGGKDLETVAVFGHKKEVTATATTASIPIGISSPFLKQEIKIELPATSAKTPVMSFSQPIRFPKVNTANNRVPAGSSKPGKHL